MKPQIIARRKIDRKIDSLQKQDADKAHIAECIEMVQRLKSEIAKGNQIVINYVKNFL